MSVVNYHSIDEHGARVDGRGLPQLLGGAIHHRQSCFALEQTSTVALCRARSHQQVAVGSLP